MTETTETATRVVQVFNLLDPAVHGDTSLPGGGLNGVCSAGGDTGGLLVAEPPALGSNFAIELTVAVVGGDGGYLFAASDATGVVRSAALFVRPLENPAAVVDNGPGAIFYYTTAGSDEQQLVEWDFATLQDEADHVLQLVVFGDTAALSVDGVDQGSRRLRGPVVDGCDSAVGESCQTFLLQRAGGVGLDGCVLVAQVTVVPPGLALAFQQQTSGRRL
jgi:hypothetical protein